MICLESQSLTFEPKPTFNFFIIFVLMFFPVKTINRDVKYLKFV